MATRLLRVAGLFSTGWTGQQVTGEHAARRLQEITVELPPASELTFSVGSQSITGEFQDLVLVAGVVYSELRLAASGRSFAASLDGAAQLRVVRGDTAADSGGCAQSDFYRYGGLGFVDAALPMAVESGDLVSGVAGVSFMLGGIYRLCFSADGTFSGGVGGTSSLLEVPYDLRIKGARLSCSGDRCVEEFPWRCFTYRNAAAPEGSCVVRVEELELIEQKNSVRLTWGAKAGIISTFSSDVIWACGSHLGNVTVYNLLAAVATPPLESGFVSPSLGTLGREFKLPVLASPSGGFSVQTCLCPRHDGADAGTDECDTSEDFVQLVGRAVFFQSRSCDDVFCTNEYEVVTPSSPFTVQVDCGGLPSCSGNLGSRIKVIDYSELGMNDLPSWSDFAGCRTALQSTTYWRPSNCEPDSVSDCGGAAGEVNGGNDPLFKNFLDLVLGPSFTGLVPTSRWFDVCYCDDGCDGSTSGSAFSADEFGFHKVGRIRVSPLTQVALRGSGERTGVTIAGLDGDLMFDGSSNVPVAPQPAQVKLLWDNRRARSNGDCSTLNSDAKITFASNILGPSCEDKDQCSYRASKDGASVVIFNDGGMLGQKLRFPRAGVVAICYCGVFADGAGQQPSGACLREGDFSYWVLMSRTLIRGPCARSASLGCQETEWAFTVGLPFRMELAGLGLRSTDKLRIIDSISDCFQNPDGGGEATVLKGCPEDCSPLDMPDTYVFGGGAGKDDIALQIDTWQHHSCDEQNQNCLSSKIIEILPSSDHTVWRFDSDPGLQTGDVIVLDDVTGGSEEQNAMISGQLGLEYLGHPVTRLADSAAAKAGLLYEVPIGLGLGFIPSFSPGVGSWHRHSYAKTREEIKATEAKTELQVCWGSGPDAYHVRAGRISFSNAKAMEEVSLSLTTLEGGRAAPMVLSFRTASGGETAERYKSAVSSMRLRLNFDSSALLEPLFADADGQSLPSVAPVSQDELDEASQSICGALFLELWSDDAKGFPLPKGCLFSSLRGGERELNVIFESKNGLEAKRNYQMVFNARVASTASTTDQVLSVWSMDDVFVNPYGVVELGSTILAQNPQRASGIGEPRFMGSGGFNILDDTGTFSDLLELTINRGHILFRLQGDGQSPIQPSSILRIFLRPLTVWSLQPLCQAECFPHATRVCGEIAVCEAQAVVASGRLNVIKLELPQDMTEIYGSTVQHTVRVSKLDLPVLGFFGTRFGAQVSLQDDSRVHYTESSGAFLWKAPAMQPTPATRASLVIARGDGNSKPFRGEEDNVLYIRVLLGATLFAELEDGDASFTLLLPAGYTCQAADSAPQTLSVFQQNVPQGRGSLPAGKAGPENEKATSGWAFSGASCTYRLRAREIIPAGSVTMIEVHVNQPMGLLPLDGDTLNRWLLELRSRGWYRVKTQEAPAAPFQSDLGALYSTAVPVLGKLQQESLQPRHFGIGSLDNQLSVFFRPEQPSGYGGQVKITAPSGYNFAVSPPDKCEVSRLPEVYYRVGNGRQDTSYLPVVEACIGICTAMLGCPGNTLNTARITLRNSLLRDFVYGFLIGVFNKESYDQSDEDGWSITTTDVQQQALDSSYPRVSLNPVTGGVDEAKGWGVFEKQGVSQSISLAFSSLLPTDVTGSLASLTIFPIEMHKTITASCRLIAPDGFELSPTDFLFHYAAISGATASWPGLSPWQSSLSSPGVSTAFGDQPPNTLLWNKATYQVGEKYGFSLKVRIPLFPVATMLHAFLLQFGWDGSILSDRPLAFVLPGPEIRSIINFEVFYGSNVVGLKQRISVVLETTSEVPQGGMLHLEVPEGFVFKEMCSVLDTPGEPPLPSAAAVACQAETSLLPDGSPKGTAVSLVPKAGPIPAGRFSFSLEVRNPTETRTSRPGRDTPCGSERCWKIEALDDRGALTDAPSYTQDFSINEPMSRAKLLDLSHPQRLATGRNDRPGRPNNIIFAFSLSKRPSSATSLVLSGPYGFNFQEDCLPGLRTASGKDGVFGDIPGGWLVGFDEWETAAKVRSCWSKGSIAKMQVELGLRAAKFYAFRIKLESNPHELPNPNSWTIEYGSESSPPFESFFPWTFTDISLTPSSKAVTSESNPIPNPVALQFRPYKEVPGDPLRRGTGGLLRVAPPRGFLAATAGSFGRSCQDYSLTGMADNEMFTPAVHLMCQVDEDVESGSSFLSFTLIGDKKLEVGRLYTLVAQIMNPFFTTVDSAAESWMVSTFNDASGALDSALDETLFPGYVLNDRFNRWTVNPPGGEKHAGLTVKGVQFEFAIFQTVGAGSQMLIRAPLGFDITSPPNCEEQVGNVLGGSLLNVGRTASLQDCAMKVWQEIPDASAVTWRIWDGACNGHIDVGSLEMCDESNGCLEAVYQVCNLRMPGKSCHNFQIKGQAMTTMKPICSKQELVFNFEPGDELKSGTIAQFVLDAKNPQENPSLMNQFWEATIFKPGGTEVLFSATTPGWYVIPQLQGAKIRLLGPLLASGSFTSIELQFRSPTFADEVSVTALEPPLFDFEMAVPKRGSVVQNITHVSTDSIGVSCVLAINELLAPALVFENVRLGTPGPAKFKVAVVLASIKSAEDLEVAGHKTFTVPGRISVDQAALTPVQQEPSDERFRNMGTGNFGPRASDIVLAKFTLRFGGGAQIGDRLVISAPPFSFPSEAQFSFKLLDPKGIEQEDVLCAPRVSELTDTRLFVILEQPLSEAETTTYSIRAAMRAGPLVDNGEQWLFDIRQPSLTKEGILLPPEQSDDSELPHSTNDAQLKSFVLVYVVDVFVTTGRVAPLSMLAFDLTVDPAGAKPDSLVVYAPEGFIFDTGNCLTSAISASSKVLSCRRQNFENQAELQLSGELMGPTTTNLQVRAPASLAIGALGNNWLVRALKQGDETGWGSVSGFGVVQMEQAQVIYGGVPSVTGHVAVIFRTSQSLMGGGIVEVQAPAMYQFSCRVVDGFDMLFIPGLKSCDDSGHGLRLHLNETVAPGDYAFIAGIQNPAFTPAVNEFNVLLIDIAGIVKDARVGLEGQRIIQGLYLEPPYLEFSSTQRGAEAEIRLVIPVTSKLDPMEALGPLRAIQVAVPDRFTLIIKDPVGNLDGLPTPETGWYHYFFLERLIRVDIVESAASQPREIPKGEYRLSFKVRLPEFWMPSVNVWLLSFCRDLICTDILATVPLTGFDFGDPAVLAPKEEVAVVTGSEQGYAVGVRPWCLIITLVCAQVVLWIPDARMMPLLRD